MRIDDRLVKFLGLVIGIALIMVAALLAVSTQGCSAYGSNPEMKRNKIPASLISVQNYPGYCMVELNREYISVWHNQDKAGFLISSMFYMDSCLYSIEYPPINGGYPHSCLFSYDGYHYLEWIRVYKGDQFTVCTPVELSLLGITLGYWDFTVYEVNKDSILLNFQGFHWQFLLNEQLYDDSVMQRI